MWKDVFFGARMGSIVAEVDHVKIVPGRNWRDQGSLMGRHAQKSHQASRLEFPGGAEDSWRDGSIPHSQEQDIRVLEIQCSQGAL
jgi:hypothetical protein